MPISDYSTSAASNTSLGGIAVGENMVRSDVNNAIRQLMADIAAYKTGLASMKSVKDPPYNAVGDGVTDDTSAIQAAINANSRIFFPRGNYKVSQLVITDAFGKELIGEDQETYIQGATAGTSIIQFGKPTGGSEVDQTKRAQYCKVANLAIYATAAYTYGIDCQWLTDSYFENVTLSGDSFIETGMRYDFSWNNDFYHCTIAAKNGITFGALSPNRTTFFGLRLAGGARGGVGFNGAGTTITLVGADISAFATGVKFDNGGFGFSIVGGYFESNGVDISLGGGGLRGASITNSTFLAGTGSNIAIQQSGASSVEGVTITGNAFRDKADCVILTSLTYGWNITGNGYTGVTRFITEGGYYHNIDELDGRYQLYAGMLDLSGVTGTNGGQIKFPASPNLSANASTLDAYLEGTFTPVVAGSSTAGAGTYSTQAGTYTRIGNRVFFDIALTWSAHTGTGNLLVTGLPFTSANSEPVSVITAYVDGMTITGEAHFIVNQNATNAQVQSVNNGTAASLALDTAATLRVTGSYRV
jgi:hypothetical protein